MRPRPLRSAAAAAGPGPGSLPLVQLPGHVVLEGGAGGARVHADLVEGADVAGGGVPGALQELVRAAVEAVGRHRLVVATRFVLAHARQERVVVVRGERAAGPRGRDAAGNEDRDPEG